MAVTASFSPGGIVTLICAGAFRRAISPGRTLALICASAFRRLTLARWHRRADAVQRPQLPVHRLGMRYTSDLTDPKWQLIDYGFPKPGKQACPREDAFRELLKFLTVVLQRLL